MLKALNVFIILLLIILPAFFGAALSGKHITFPVRFIEKKAFSLKIFLIFLLADLFMFLFLAYFLKKAKAVSQNKASFPWWGYLSIFFMTFFWILAWTRFPWFSDFQRYTFAPLWFSYIFLVNAIDYWRTGSCFIKERPIFFILLFPLSSIFWWTFEYLNTFIQNWYYINVPEDTFVFSVHATLCFSTVLPAVISTRELLSKTISLKGFWKIKVSYSYKEAIFLMFFSCLGLFFLSIFPDYLFPFVWVFPLFIITSFQMLTGKKTIFSDICSGDWNTLVCSSISGLICGFFWEMWNFWSFAKWKYSIPFVDCLHVFEMPILGYGGYIPFGLICSAFVKTVEN